jgi:hypothetical protein
LAAASRFKALGDFGFVDFFATRFRAALGADTFLTVLVGDFFAFEAFAGARAAFAGFFAGLAASFVAILKDSIPRAVARTPSRRVVRRAQ